jgi:hypothetical protein
MTRASWDAMSEVVWYRCDRHRAKPGRDVLLFVPGSARTPIIVIGQWNMGEWLEGTPVGEAYVPMDVAPTHWAVLPEPPRCPTSQP